METDILKKEFEKFQKENLIQMLECGYCQKSACESFHRKFLVKSCHNFNKAKEILFKGFDQTGK